MIATCLTGTILSRHKLHEKFPRVTSPEMNKFRNVFVSSNLMNVFLAPNTKYH